MVTMPQVCGFPTSSCFQIFTFELLCSNFKTLELPNFKVRSRCFVYGERSFPCSWHFRDGFSAFENRLVAPDKLKIQLSRSIKMFEHSVLCECILFTCVRGMACSGEGSRRGDRGDRLKRN